MTSKSKDPSEDAHTGARASTCMTGSTRHTLGTSPRDVRPRNRPTNVRTGPHTNQHTEDRRDTETQTGSAHKRKVPSLAGMDTSGDEGSETEWAPRSARKGNKRAKTTGRKKRHRGKGGRPSDQDPARTKRPKRPRPHQILHPTPREDGSYEWPGLAVRTSPTLAGIMGVLAEPGEGKTIPAATYIPLLGRRIRTRHLDRITSEMRHVYPYCGKMEERGAVDGNPSYHPHQGVGCKGLAIALMVNEPKRGPPNCIFKRNCLVTTCDIPHGAELTVYYGPSIHYVRDYDVEWSTIRDTQGNISGRTEPSTKALAHMMIPLLRTIGEAQENTATESDDSETPVSEPELGPCPPAYAMAQSLVQVLNNCEGMPDDLRARAETGVDCKPILDIMCGSGPQVEKYCEKDTVQAIRAAGRTRTAVLVSATPDRPKRATPRGIAVALTEGLGEDHGAIFISIAHKTQCKDVALLPAVITAARQTPSVTSLLISPMQGMEHYLVPYYTGKLGFRMRPRLTSEAHLQPTYVLHMNKAHQWSPRIIRATGTTGQDPTGGYRHGDNGRQSVRLQRADWLPEECADRNHTKRGLFTCIEIPYIPYKAREPITPYAGYIIGNEDATDDHPAQTAYYVRSVFLPRMIIDGFREPREGWGMAQFCNDPRDTDRVNCELKVHGGMLCLFPKARTIRAGEELFISYGAHYWTRIQEADQSELRRPYTMPLEPGGRMSRKKRPETTAGEAATTSHRVQNQQRRIGPDTDEPTANVPRTQDPTVDTRRACDAPGTSDNNRPTTGQRTPPETRTRMQPDIRAFFTAEGTIQKKKERSKRKQMDPRPDTQRKPPEPPQDADNCETKHAQKEITSGEPIPATHRADEDRARRRRWLRAGGNSNPRNGHPQYRVEPPNSTVNAAQSPIARNRPSLTPACVEPTTATPTRPHTDPEPSGTIWEEHTRSWPPAPEPIENKWRLSGYITRNKPLNTWRKIYAGSMKAKRDRMKLKEPHRELEADLDIEDLITKEIGGPDPTPHPEGPAPAGLAPHLPTVLETDTEGTDADSDDTRDVLETAPWMTTPPQAGGPPNAGKSGISRPPLDSHKRKPQSGAPCRTPRPRRRTKTTSEKEERIDRPIPAARPRAPGARWTTGPTDKETCIETALSQGLAYALKFESNWGINSPLLHNCWEEVSHDMDLWHEIQGAWPPYEALESQLAVSVHHQVVRQVHVLQKGVELRYITPHSVWAHTMNHDGTSPVQIEPEPTPLPALPVMAASLHLASIGGEQVEARIRLQYHLSTAARIQGYFPYSIRTIKSYRNAHTEATERYWCSALTDGSPVCPGCMTDNQKQDKACNSEVTISMNQYFRNVSIRCTRTGKARVTCMNDDMHTYFFGQPDQWRAQPEAKHTRPPAGTTLEDDLEKGDSEPSDNEGGPDDEQVEMEPMPHSLTVITYNTDGGARRRAPEILAYAAEVSADVILLQDVEGLPWSRLALLERGWTMYDHKRCAILLKVKTAEHTVSKVRVNGKKDPVVWRSQCFNSMAITLDTKEGPAVIVCAYIPPGVDSLASDPGNPKTAKILAQHREIDTLIRGHEFGIVGMDANETIHGRGRAQVRDHSILGYTGTHRGEGLGRSMMRTYGDHMSDCHGHYTSGDLGQGERYPRLKDMTFLKENSTTRTTTRSKIDYLLASNKLAARLEHCEVDARTRAWTDDGNPRKSFHSAIKATFNWEGMWLAEDAEKGRNPLKGSSIKAHPNYAALTPATSKTIARMVHERLRRKWKRMRACWTSKTRPKHMIRDTLLRDLKKEMLRAAKSVLGVSRPKRRPGPMSPSAEVDDAWKDLICYVGRALGTTVETIGETSRISLDGPELAAIREKLKSAGVDLPRTRPAWVAWWHRRDFHHAEAIMNKEDIILTDNLAARDPKRFFSQVTKPFSSAKIEALRKGNEVITTDEGIEDELHSYIQGIAAISQHKPKKGLELPPRAKAKVRNLGMTKFIEMDELILYIQSLDSTSAAGQDGLSPALLKAVLLTTWTEHEPKTDEDKWREGLQTSYSEYCSGKREQLRYKQGPLPLEPPGDSSPTVAVTYEPNLARQMVRRILNLCLQTKNLPQSEKIGIITGLPKSEGLVTDTSNIRPITVGQAMSRLLHKVLAGRLSTYLVRHNMIDRAQAAFIPGGDIHEPISAATACYRDRISQKKGCYAVYYDISKAYDTIRWESIREALQAIGMEQAFIDLVMNSLEGSTTAMRTNVPGRITRSVTLHKSIKQGCPLAPLLFIIVMDELHRELKRARIGYQLSSGDMVTSRGYCDDTYIVSSSLSDLRRMNDIVHAVFSKHGLHINATKTKVTGRHADGTPLTESLRWPGSDQLFDLVPPEGTVRYLGAQISLDLNWTAQVNQMQGSVMGVISHLESNRLTLYQGVALTRFVTGPKMEIGMRHADVPMDKLKEWDRWTAAALAKSAGLAANGLHHSGIFTPTNIVPMEHQYILTKVAHAMELVTRKSQLREYHKRALNPTLTAIAAVMDSQGDGENAELPSAKALKHISTKAGWKNMATALCTAAQNGMWVKSKHTEKRAAKLPRMQNGKDKISESSAGKGHHPYLIFKGARIPTRITHDLWGSGFDKLEAIGHLLAADEPPPALRDLARRRCTYSDSTYHHPDCPAPSPGKGTRQASLGHMFADSTRRKRAKCAHCRTKWHDIDAELNDHVRVMICTDGSTYGKARSGAALTFMDDGARNRELWGNAAYGWQILANNNYMAELAAIHKSLRSVPVNVALDIHTDSQSAIDAIKASLRNPEGTNYLRKGGRPYVMAICRAWTSRQEAGADTTLRHVRAHTGERTTAAIGNAAADRWAKWYAMSADEGPDTLSCLDLMAAELPYVLWTRLPPGPPGPLAKGTVGTPAHGDVRKEGRQHLQRLYEKEWAYRTTRGQMVREHPESVRRAGTRVRNAAQGTRGLTLAVACLNNITLKEVTPDGVYTGKKCERCGTGKDLTVEHRYHECPCNVAELNQLDEDVGTHTGFPADVEVRGPCPTALADLISKWHHEVINIVKMAQPKEHRAAAGPAVGRPALTPANKHRRRRRPPEQPDRPRKAQRLHSISSAVQQAEARMAFRWTRADIQTAQILNDPLTPPEGTPSPPHRNARQNTLPHGSPSCPNVEPRNETNDPRTEDVPQGSPSSPGQSRTNIGSRDGEQNGDRDPKEHHPNDLEGRDGKRPHPPIRDKGARAPAAAPTRARDQLNKLVECIKHARSKHDSWTSVPEQYRNRLKSHAARCGVRVRSWDTRVKRAGRTKKQVTLLMRCIERARILYDNYEDIPEETRSRLKKHADGCGLAIKRWESSDTHLRQASQPPRASSNTLLPLEMGPASEGRELTLTSSHQGRQVRLGTAGSLEQYTLLYAIEASIRPRGPEGNHPGTTPPREIQETIRAHLGHLAADLGRWDPRTQAPGLRAACRKILRTYSDLYLNPLTAVAPWDATWRSRHAEDWRLGGITTETAEEYLRDRYTWVSMRQGSSAQAEDLKAAADAMANSRRPGRVVLLTMDNPALREWLQAEGQDTCRYCIVTMDQTSDPILHLDDHKLPRDAKWQRALHRPTSKLALVVVETRTAPDFCGSQMRQALRGINGIRILQHPHTCDNMPPGTGDRELTNKDLAYRPHPLLRESQTWYKPCSKLKPWDEERQEIDGIKLTTADRLPAPLALLGELPRGIQGVIAEHNGTRPNRDAMKSISESVLNCTLSILKKDEAFRKWRSKT